MDKLELRHLAPYLPYGLKIQMNDGDIFTLYGIKGKNRMIYIELHGESVEDLTTGKPILRPLSDLTKEIEHIKDINELCNGDCESWNDINYRVFTKSRARVSGNTVIQVYTYLISKHYDLFGLIDKNLAININKL